MQESGGNRNLDTWQLAMTLVEAGPHSDIRISTF
jgi:hypothetical protein